MPFHHGRRGCVTTEQALEIEADQAHLGAIDF